MAARSSSWLASGGSTGTAPARAIAEAKLMAKRKETRAAIAKSNNLVVAAENKSCERPGTGESPEVITSDEDVAERSGTPAHVMPEHTGALGSPAQVPRSLGKGSGKLFEAYHGGAFPPKISAEREAHSEQPTPPEIRP